MQKLINWCKQYGLLVITLFLLAFIPLYPKLPIINVIRTWVYIRLEDFFIVGASAVLLWVLVKARKIPDSPLTIPIICYWIAGGISLGNALILIFPHIAGLYPHLGFLHYARRIEYMILFFLAFEAYRRKPILASVLWTLMGSYLLIILYGFGQKFLGFPAFLTMNEEFAKGVPLRLPPTARFPSTFGGHYDLAAYLVFTIPIIGSFLVSSKKVWQWILYTVLTFLGLIMLLFTASRISFMVYLIAISFMLVWQKKKWLIIPWIILSILILNLTSGTSERFYKTFRVSDVVVDLSTGKPIGTLDKLEGQQATLQKSASPATENLPSGSEYINLAGGNKNQINSVELFISKNVPGATGEIATVSGSFLIQKALVYDISITTRFQAEWPEAIAAFKRNLLFGSGYSSLSLATDGDYHRMFGETGILGFVGFMGIFAVSFLLFTKRKDLLAPSEKTFVIGVYAGIVGLMVNAVLIDVFEASKVAYTLWLVLGLTTAMLVAKKPFHINYFQYIWKLATHKIAFLLYLLIALWLIWSKVFSLFFIGDDFTWLRWAAQGRIHDLAGYFTNSQGFFYRPIPKLWYFVLFSVFWLTAPAYHIMSIFLMSATVLLVYHILLRLNVKRAFALAGSFLFGVLSVHHESVYWISGQSSLLAGFFILGSVSLLMEGEMKSRSKLICIVASYIALFAAMLSYDGMLIAPIVVFVIAMSVVKKKAQAWPYLLLIPSYWVMRNWAHALLPQGDYAYKASTFFVNTVGNTVGYTLSVFFGPWMVEHWNDLRLWLRPFLKEMTAGLVVVFVVLVLTARSWLSKLSIAKRSLIWMVCFGVSLAAYVPLGGMAERYVYIPSMFLIIGLTVLIFDLWQKANSLIPKIVIVVLYISLVIFNIREVRAVGNDWEKASSIVDQTLRVVKQEAFPPKNIKRFYIVNTPIRYGRAWVFPTGLTDALWQIYRNSPYFVIPVKSIEEGYRIQFDHGDREVFIFENYIFKRGVSVIQVLPSQTTHEKIFQ
jgi:hypothetical protein